MSLQGVDVKNPKVRFDVEPGSALSDIDLSERLLAFEHTESLGKSDEKVTLRLKNDDGELTRLERLALGVRMHVAWGYDLLQSPVRSVTIRRVKGYVAHAGAGAPAASGGAPTVEYEGRGKIVELNRVVARGERRVFRGMKVSDVVLEIARRNGYDRAAYIEDTEEVLDQVAMRVGESEAQFLHRLAKMEANFAFSISDRGFHFGRVETGPAVEEIAFFEGPDVLAWEIDGDFTLPVPGSVRTRDLRDVGAAVDVSLAAPETVGIALVDRVGPASAAKERLIAFDDVWGPPSRSPSKAAVRRLEKTAFNSWKVKLTLVGNPRVFVRTTLNLMNFGPLLDGLWLARDVTHHIESGYTTTVTMGRRGITTERGGERTVGTAVDTATAAPETVGVTFVERAPVGGRPPPDWASGAR